MFVWIACTFKVPILLHKLHDKQCGIWKLEAPDCSLHCIKNRLPNLIVSILDELGIWITSCWSRVISADLLQIQYSLLSVAGCHLLPCCQHWSGSSGSWLGQLSPGPSAFSEAQADAWELHSNCSAWAFPGSCPDNAVLPCCKEALGQGVYWGTTETPHIVQRFYLTLNRQVLLTEISVLSAAAWSRWCGWLLQLPNPLCRCAFHSVSWCHSTLPLNNCVLICCLVTLLLCFPSPRVSSDGFLISYIPFPCSEAEGRCSKEYLAFCNS